MRTPMLILAAAAAALLCLPAGLRPAAAQEKPAAPPSPGGAAAPAAPPSAAPPAVPAEPKAESAPPAPEAKPAPAAPAEPKAEFAPPAPEAKPAPAAPAEPKAESAPPAPAAPEASPAPAVQAPPLPRDQFRFQFDGIPYDDIIRRFAQMAGKPLLGDVRVEGTLTFFDSEPYTFQEAFGLFNTLLQMKGFTIRETPRFLQVLSLQPPGVIQKSTNIYSGLEAARDVRPDQIITVMIPLRFITADDAAKALQTLVSQFGSLTSAGRGRGLFITDRMENIRRVKSVLDQLDTSTLAPAGERLLRTFVLKNASARDIATIINNIFGASGLGVGMGGEGGSGGVPRYIRNPENGEWMRNPEWNPESESRRPSTPATDTSVKSTADERTNTLFVAGPSDKLAMAEELILKLDQIRPEQTGDMRIFELKNAKAEEVANTLRQMLIGTSTTYRSPYEGQRYEGSRYQPPGMGQQGMQTRVVADAATNRIIVTAPLDQMTRIEELIKQLDQANIKYVGGVKVFPLKVADAQQLVSIMSNSLRRAAPQEMTSRGMQPTSAAAQVSADTRTNSLIVAGNAGDLQAAETLIQELDKPLEGTAAAREIRVVQLKAGDARQVASALQNLLRQQQEGGGVYGRYGSSSVSSNIRVEAETATNSLLISAAPGDWETIQKVLEQLEASVIPQTTASTRLLPLKFAKATSLAETLNQIYGAAARSRYGSGMGFSRYSSTPAPGAIQVPVVIAADERANMLIVSAAEDDQKAIADLVAKMDVQGAEAADQVRIIRLKAGDAVKIAETLRGLYQPQGGRYGSQAQASQVFIQGDLASNSLLVRAPDVEFRIIEKMASDLDQVITQVGGIKTFRLKVADAQQLATVLQSALAKRETYSRYGSGIQQTIVSSDVRTNSIIVAGPAADIQTAETLIQELDKPLDETAREIHVVQLKAGDARQMATSLVSLLRQQEAAGRYGGTTSVSNIRVEAEPVTNSLLISSAPGDWPVIQKILDQLKEAAGPLSVAVTRLIPLAHAKASELAETLRQVFSSQGAYGASAYASGRGRLFGQSSAAAMPGQSTVPVVIAASDANNSLLVSASEEDHKAIADLVKLMDVPAAEGAAGVRMVRLESADAVKLAETLKAMIPAPTRGQPPSVVIQADPGSNTLLLRAAEADRKLFEDMIASLDKAAIQQARETRMIPLKHVSAATLAAMLTQLYPQSSGMTMTMSGFRRPGSTSGTSEDAGRVVIAAAPGDRAIVVDAPRDKIEEIVHLVAGIDVPGGPGELQVRTYRLASAKAAEIAPALTRLFAQQQSRTGRQVGPEMELQPRFEADVATNHVIVAAGASQFETIEKLIKELEAGTSLARETRTWRLKFAKAPEIAEMLQTMLVETPAAGPMGPRGMRGETFSAAADVRVAAMAETNDVVVQGPPEKIALADELIKTFDAQASENHIVVQIVQLKNAQAVTLAEAVNATLAERPVTVSMGGPRRMGPGAAAAARAVGAAPEAERVIVTPEINSNSAIVRGPAADVPPVVEMIRQLDAGSTSGGAQVRVFPLANSDPTTLAASLAKLFQEMIRQAGAGGRGQPAIPFSIAPDDRTRSLVVTTTPSYFALVEQILKQVDQSEAAPAQDVQYFSLQNADPTEVASQLTDMYKDRKGPDKPIITADAFSNAVTVIAKGAELKAVEQIIAKLDDVAKDTSFRVRIIPLTQVKAEKMAAVLRTVYSQATGAEVNVTDDPSSLLPDGGAGVAPVRDLAKPPATPPSAATPAPGGSGSTKPGPAAEQREKPSGKEKGGGGSPRERSKGGGGRRRQPQADEFPEFFIYKAPAAQPASPAQPPAAPAASAATAGPGAPAAPAASAAIAAPAVVGQPGAPAAPAGQPAAAAPNGQAPRVTIGVDKTSNSIILSGKRQDLDYLESLINQLTPSSATAEAEFRIFKIAKADPTAVARTLDALFNPRPVLQMQRGPQGQPIPVPPPPPVINAVPDVRTASLIVRAKPLDFELLEPIITHLDQIPTVASDIRIFTLKNTDATEVATNLKELFGLTQQRQQSQAPQPQPQQQGQQGGRPSPQDQRSAMIRQMMEVANKGGITQIDVTSMMSITPNRQTNSVVVAAPSEVMVIVERVIQELDQSGVTGVASVRLYPVKNADVKTLVTALQEIFVSGGGAGGAIARLAGRMGGGPALAARPSVLEAPVVITGDEAGRLIIVSAPPEKHEVISKVIDEMDQAQAAGDVTVRVYHLLNADATTVAPALASTIERAGAAGGAGGGRGGPGAAQAAGQVRISADRSSNCLVVRASALDHEKIAKLIAEMDAGSEPLVQMYPLRNADVRSTVTALQDIFGSRAGGGAVAVGGRRGGPAGAGGDRSQILIAGDEAARLVIVSAPADKQTLVAQVIKEIDEAQGAGDVTVKVYRLENADATTMATALMGALERAGGPAGGGGGGRGAAAAAAGGGAVRISPDRGSNSLVVRASAADHEKIAKLIGEMDISISEQFAVRLIPLNNADPAGMAAVLGRVFAAPAAAAAAGPRGARGQAGPTAPPASRSPVVIEADREARMLMVRADDEMFEKIKALAQQLDVASQGGEVTTTVLALKFAQAVAVAPVLNQAFAVPGTAAGGRAAGGRAPGGAGVAAAANPDDFVSVLAEATTNSLIVTASAKNLGKVKSLLEKLDTELAGVIRTELLILKNARAADVAPVLQRMVQAGQAAAGGGRGAAGRAAGGAAAGAGEVVVSADSGSNGLVISGPSADVDKVLKMARDLDQATGEPLVKMYPLKNADARATVQALQEVFGARGPTGAAGPRRGAGAGGAAAAVAGGPAEVVITADEAGRQVIVSAPEPKHALIAKVIQEIDDAQGAGDVTVKVYRLENADATTMATALQGTVERAGGPASGGGGGRGGAQAAAGGAGGGAIRISPDRGSNSLIVRASAADHERIARLISEMDVAPGEQYAVRLVPLNNADATSVAAVLQRVFSGIGGSGAAGGRGARGQAGPAASARQAVVIEADRDSRMIMVRADDETFEKIKALAQQLDTASTGRAAPTVIALKFAQASSVAPALSQAFGTAGRGGGAAGRAVAGPDDLVTIVAEPTSNSLIVTANSQNLDKVKGLLEKLDNEDSGRVRTELLILKNARAAELAPILQRISQEGPRGAAGVRGSRTQPAPAGAAAARPAGASPARPTGAAPARPATSATATGAAVVSADAGSNAIVITGTSQEVDRILKMARDLDQATGEAVIRLYQLKNADVRAAVAVLQDLFGGRGGASSATVRRTAGAAAMAVATLPGEVIITSDETSRVIVVAASEAKHELIGKIVEQLDELQAAGEVAVRVYHLLNADATTVAAALQSTVDRAAPPGGGPARGAGAGPAGSAAQVRISADRSSNCIVVRASAEDHAKISQLIAEMDAGSEAVVQMYPLKNADVRTTLVALQEIFGQRGGAAASGAGAARRGGAAAAAAERAPVVITGDEAARLIIVSAPAEKQQLVAKVIKEMDDAQGAGDVTVKVYRLENADATSMATALTATLERAGGPAAGGGGRGGAGAAAAAGGGGAVRISPDRGSNSLVVRASAADHEKIARLIADMDISLTEQYAVRLIPLANADAANVAAVLQRVFAGVPAAAGAPGARGARGQAGPTAAPASRQAVVIEGDRDSRVLMVRAEDETFEKIKALAQQLDTAAVGKAVPTVIALKFAQAAAVAPVLTQAFGLPARGGAGGRTQAGSAAVNPDDLVLVVAEPMSNSLIVTANAANLEKVEALVAKLDTDVAGGMRTELLILKNARAADVAPVLQRMVQTTLAAGAGGRFGAGGATAGGAAAVVVSADVGSNGLVVSGPAAEIEKVLKMARDLDQATGEPLVKMYQLKNADVRATVTALQELFGSRGATGTMGPRRAPGAAAAPAASAGGVGDVVITADEVGRQVIVSAPAQKHELVSQVIKEMDDAAASDKLIVKIYRLSNADATSVAPALSSALEKTAPSAMGGAGGARGTTASGTQIRISADRSSNTLVVRASPEDHERVAQLITEMDVAPTEQYAVQLIPLNTADATNVAQVLTRIFTGAASGAGALGRAAGGGAGPRPPVIIEADRDARMLMVRADDPTFEKIQALAQKMDVASKGQAAPTVIPLKYAQAAGVAPTLAAAFAPRPGAGGRTGAPANPDDIVTVVAEPMSNSLVVTANSMNLEKVNSLLTQLDTQTAGGMRTELKILKNAKANDIAPVLQRMVQAGGATGKAAPGSVTVSADVGSNGLVISGPSTEVDKVLKMVVEIDDATTSTVSNVYVVALRNGDATTVSQMVRDLYAQQATAAVRDKKSIDPLAVSADTRSNAVVLATTKQMYEQVTQWVNQIETMTAPRGAVRIITLQNADPAELDKAIKQIFGPATGAGTTTIPVRGPRGEAGPTGAAAPSGATTAGGKVETTVLSGQKSVLISASEEDYETIRKLAEALDAAAAEAKRQVQVFPLKNANNTRVALALTNLYRAAAAARPGVAAPTVEDTVTVVALPDTNAVVVTASKIKMEEVAHLISELDKLEIAPQLEYRVFPLANATPTKVMPQVNQMLTQLKLTRPDEPVNIQADERTRSLIVTARGPMFDQVGKIIETLDKAPTFAQVDVLIVPLKKADAARLAAVLNEMLRPSATGAVTPEALALQEQIRLLRVLKPDGAQIPDLDLTKPIKVSSDPAAVGAGAAAGAQGSNSLIITSTPDNLRAMKAVVEILDTVPVIEGVKVRIIHLKNADAASVANVLREVFTQGLALAGKPGTSVAGRAEPESVVGKALVNPFNVSADLRTNSVVMSGLEESLALAELIVRDLDRDAGEIVTEVRLFRLKNADVTRLVPILQQVFAEGAVTGAAAPGAAAAGAIEGLRTQVTRLKTILEKQLGHVSDIPKTRAALTIQGDPATSIIVVAARSDVMPLIADVIQTMDVAGAGSLNTVRIFPLVNADATRMKTVIDGLYTGPNAQLVRIEDRPTTQVDVRTNALVVNASDKTFAMLETLLKTLDAKLPIEMRDIRLVPLTNADAATLAPVLQQMMDARVQRVQTLGAADAEALRVIVIADSRSNCLIVGGSAEGFELVKSLAEQLDAAGAAIAGQIQLMPLKNANAGAISTTLSAFFTQRYALARTPDIARQRPVIMADVRTNAILVAANADDTRIIVGLLEKLDVELADPAVQLVLVPLKFNDAGVVGPELQRLFAARLVSMTLPGQTPVPQDRVDIGTDALSNSLIISASKENLALIKGLLEKLDVEPPPETGIVRMYALQNSDASRIVTLLQGLISQGLYKPGAAVAAQNPLLAARERVAITADVRTNVIIVSASRENFAVIEEIIRKIDSSEDYSLLGDIRIFILKNATSTRLAPTLQQLFAAKRAAEQAAGGTGRMLPVSVFADARTNALLVTGSKESFNAIEAMIRELDTDQVLAANEFQVFYLKQATAQVLAPTLQQLFAQRVSRGVPLDPVTVVIEQRTNALIVSASPEDMKLAESLIARLDAEADRPGTAVQVFPLVKADATQVSTTINNLYRAQAAGVGAAAAGPPVVVSVDERINALIVSAGPADQKRIGELVRQLDSDTVPRVTEIRVFTLENADATELAAILTAALNNKPVPLTAQSPNRQTLLQFITKTREGGELVASALQEGVLINPDRRTNSLVVSAPLENMPLLESLIKAMDSTTPRMAEIKVFQLQNADARQMATVLLQLFRLQTATGAAAPVTGKQAIEYTLKTQPEPEKGPAAVMGNAEEIALSVTVDIRTNSLLVGGTKRYVDLASKVIEELDASAADERLTEVYRLRNAQAADIQTAVSNFLNQERTLLTQALGTGMGATQFILDREVAIVAEPTTNTLLLSASPRYFDVIAQLIAELDQPPPQVLVQVLLAEVTIGDSTDFGMDWSFTERTGANTTSRFRTDFGVSANLTPGFSVSVTGGDISYYLRALQAQNRMEVLSRPQILASDNQMATINIGQRVPFITNSRVTETGTTINTVQYEQIGIILNVIPRINPDGFVKLTVAPEISSLSDADVQISPGVRAVIINSRSAETTVTVQDGHTIIIGGLITTNDQNVEDKVPILGDIPILGWLFKSTHVSKERTELLIILTPTVIRNIQDADNSTHAQVKRLNLLREGKRDMLQRSIFKPLEDTMGEPINGPAESSGRPSGGAPPASPPRTPADAPATKPPAPAPAAAAAGAPGPKETVK
ncbi:MAG: hypothetical protein FJ288_02375 [Planctomycetes bacterium]|nr:hypothetical protein [Planctomycetota bacterium]